MNQERQLVWEHSGFLRITLAPTKSIINIITKAYLRHEGFKIRGDTAEGIADKAFGVNEPGRHGFFLLNERQSFLGYAEIEKVESADRQFWPPLLLEKAA